MITTPADILAKITMQLTEPPPLFQQWFDAFGRCLRCGHAVGTGGCNNRECEFGPQKVRLLTRPWS